MPSISSGEPNVNRCAPLMTSTPTVDMANPKSAEMMPLSRLSPINVAKSSSPRKTMRKYSEGPNDAAKLESAGANAQIRTTPTAPPTKEATACITSAGPARPACASG